MNVVINQAAKRSTHVDLINNTFITCPQKLYEVVTGVAY